MKSAIFATVAAVLVVSLGLASIRSGGQEIGTDGSRGKGLSLITADYDNDGLLDFYQFGPGGPGRLIANLGSGRYEDRTELTLLDQVGAVAFAAWSDLNNDRWQDLVVVSPEGQLELFIGDGQAFSDQTAALGSTSSSIAGPVQAVDFDDYDLNGWLDLLVQRVDSSSVVVFNYGDLIFEVGKASSPPLVASGALVQQQQSKGPAAGPGPGPSGTAPLVPPIPNNCSFKIQDQATGNCIPASSQPTLGKLYPLTSDLFVSPSHMVGIRNATPMFPLDVNGTVNVNGSISFGPIGSELIFPDGSSQTSAQMVGPQGDDGPPGAQGVDGGLLPAGAIIMTAAIVDPMDPMHQPPAGFLLCDGGVLSPASFPDLFAAIGTTYGGNGITTFNLPNLKQRFPLGKADSGTGAVLGGTGGSIDHTHTSAAHTHDLSNHTHAGPSHSHTMAHTHSIPGHFHNSRATGADIQITSSGSHTHNIRFKNTGDTTGAVRKIPNDPVNNFDGTDGNTIEASSHTHANTSFTGRVGLVTGGSNGDAAFTSGGSSAATTGSDGTGQTGVPSNNTSGSTTPGSTGSGNPPFVVVNFIIKA